MLWKTNSTQYYEDTGMFRVSWIICIFKGASYQNIFINFDLYPKNDNGYFVVYFAKAYGWKLM